MSSRLIILIFFLPLSAWGAISPWSLGRFYPWNVDCTDLLDEVSASPHAVRVIGFRTKKHGLFAESVSIPKELVKQLAQLGDPKSDREGFIPSHLETLVQPGEYLRLYFNMEDTTVRLSVQRNQNGQWLFGATTADNRTASERTPLTTNEKLYLEHPHMAGTPARLLRELMRNMRMMFLKQQIRTRYDEAYKNWLNTIVTATGSSDLTEKLSDFLLHTRNEDFNLAEGFVVFSQKVGEQEAKITAGIQYLLKNKLRFVPDIIPGTPAGIYPADGLRVGPVLTISFHFEEAFLKALEQHGLHYKDGKWSPSQHANKKDET